MASVKVFNFWQTPNKDAEFVVKVQCSLNAKTDTMIYTKDRSLLATTDWDYGAKELGLIRSPLHKGYFKAKFIKRDCVLSIGSRVGEKRW